jgi:ferric-dicitrate binding protein FerR (iron transport regulator)
VRAPQFRRNFIEETSVTKLRVPAKVYLAFGIVCAALLHAAPIVAAQSDAVGSTESVLRQVRAIQEMDVRELDVGEDVFAKDDVATGERSAVKITFEDGTAFTMGPNSRVALENIPAVGDEPDSFLLRAARGVFKFVSGALNPEAYRIDTPTATIGVRGTVVPFRVQENLTEVSCLSGQVWVGARFNWTPPRRYDVGGGFHVRYPQVRRAGP